MICTSKQTDLLLDDALCKPQPGGEAPLSVLALRNKKAHREGWAFIGWRGAYLLSTATDGGAVAVGCALATFVAAVALGDADTLAWFGVGILSMRTVTMLG